MNSGFLGAADAMRSAIKQGLGWAVRVPRHGETVKV